MGILQDIKQVPGAEWGAIRSKMQTGSVNAKFHDNLMKPFPEGIVGSKNFNTISDTIAGHINSGNPEKAVAYAKDQSSKIAAQKTTKKVPRY